MGGLEDLDEYYRGRNGERTGHWANGIGASEYDTNQRRKAQEHAALQQSRVRGGRRGFNIEALGSLLFAFLGGATFPDLLVSSGWPPYAAGALGGFVLSIIAPRLGTWAVLLMFLAAMVAIYLLFT